MRRFKNILCVVERADACEPALERAVALAEENRALLTVVDVVDADQESGIIKTTDAALKLLVGPYARTNPIETKVLRGVPFEEVVREVLRFGRDLVIKIPESCDWLDRIMGGGDKELLRYCPCPVLIAKPAPSTRCRRILAAVDLDSSYPPEELHTRQALNRQIFEMATSLALSDSAELHLVHAWHAVGESAMHGAFLHKPEQEIARYVEEVRREQTAKLEEFLSLTTGLLKEEARCALHLKSHLVEGWPRKVIPEVAREIDADLVVMGSVARIGVPGWVLGNTAEKILDQLKCSVLAIKPPGFVSPLATER